MNAPDCGHRHWGGEGCCRSHGPRGDLPGADGHRAEGGQLATELHPMLLVVDAIESVETRSECRQLAHDRPGSDNQLRVNVIEVPAHLPSIPT